jgi:two-component system response regulator HydG
MTDRAHAPTVLVVDDESGILQTLEILLRAEGFAPHVAHGGKAALELIPRLSPDIVLSDVRMPQVTGVEVLAAARAHDPDVPVILMTAQATLQTAMQAVNAGAFYYIQKPFRNDELIAILKRAAEHRQLRMENTSLKKEIRGERRARRRSDAASRGSTSDWPRRWHPIRPCSSPANPGRAEVRRYILICPHAAQSFLSINCGALPESLLERAVRPRGVYRGRQDKTGRGRAERVVLPR